MRHFSARFTTAFLVFCAVGTSIVAAPTAPVAPQLVLQSGVNGFDKVLFSPNGKLMATTGSDVQIWDVASRVLLRTLPADLTLNAVAFSPDGKLKQWWTGGDDKCVTVWDIATGAPLLQMRGHTDSVDCVAYSPDGKWIASGSSDYTVRVWNAASGAPSQTLTGHDGNVLFLAFRSDSSELASAPTMGPSFGFGT